jgi:hypothetical protein
VVHNRAPGATFADLRAGRAAVQSHLIFPREPKAPYVDDVVLLGDVADAFKHFKLDRPNRTVEGADAIIMTGTGWGKLRWGEGKWGGAEQVIVERKNGDQRAVSSVMQNVFDAWLALLGQPLPRHVDHRNPCGLCSTSGRTSTQDRALSILSLGLFRQLAGIGDIGRLLSSSCCRLRPKRNSQLLTI